jgi:PAS domain S-box-containing protein
MVSKDPLAELQMLRAILDALPFMVFAKDAKDLRFVYINKFGEKLIGQTFAQLAGKNDFDFFPSDQAEQFQTKDRVALYADAPIEIEAEPLTSAGETVWLRTIKKAVRDEQGQPMYLLGISEDITRLRTKYSHEVEIAKNQLQQSLMQALTTSFGGASAVPSSTARKKNEVA